ncbi:MAG: DUF4004 family protein [Firmicutes bacterium]|nr:DUF4004 family protein [Bacillota bacterium]
MDEHLISKKDLLQRYGISYGALYRWKRMGLIPEEWFIKRSTPTGQETFFDEETICARIDMIIAAKDSVSLEELSKHLKPTQVSDPELVIETTYGSYRFRAGDIRRIMIGDDCDITDEVVRIITDR